MPPPDARRARERLLLLLALLALCGCGREELVHGLDEAQANEVVVALDEAGVASEKRRGDGAGDAEGSWAIAVGAGDAGRARRVLAGRELPRVRAPGFAEVFGKGSMVPTPTEERARYLHALAGELSRSVEAVDGVVAARVHLAVPPPDPLRASPQAPPRASVLVKARPGARARVEPLAPGIQALVAGAVAGLEAAAVSVVVSEALPPPASAPARRLRAPLLLAAAAFALTGAAALAAPPLRARARALLRRGPA